MRVAHFSFRFTTNSVSRCGKYTADRAAACGQLGAGCLYLHFAEREAECHVKDFDLLPASTFVSFFCFVFRSLLSLIVIRDAVYTRAA